MNNTATIWRAADMHAELSIGIDGMTRASCVARVEKPS